MRWTLSLLLMISTVTPIWGCGRWYVQTFGYDSGGDSSTGESGSVDSGSAESVGSFTTAEGEADGDGDGDADTTMDGDFLPSPDGGPPPGCDPGTQDCPNAEEKCTAYVLTPGYCCVDANKCVPIIGDKQFGDACDRTEDNDDCGKGLFCMTKTSGDTGAGVCIAFCDGANSESCAEAGLPEAHCLFFGNGIFPVCEDDCHPLQMDCEDSLGCYACGDQGFFCIVPGYESDKGNDGDECYAIQSCKPGLICAAGNGQTGCMADACCTPFCDVAGMGEECVAMGEECVPYYEMDMAPPGYEDVGLCSIPG